MRQPIDHLDRPGSRRTGRVAGLVCTLVTTGFALPALAHHSFAMYDQNTTRTLTGKLTRFIPGANHAQLIFELVGPDGQPVLDTAGKAVVWGIEMGRAAEIARQGVSVDNFPPGTLLSVTLHPLRDGRNFGAQVRNTPVIKCGTALPEGGCTAESGEVFLTVID